jgi:RNA polymerase sigma-70 factor (ECF subfamily)
LEEKHLAMCLILMGVFCERRMSIGNAQSGVDERGLVRAVQAGDRAAFRAIYEHYQDRIFNLIYYSIGDRAAAQDVLQIAFLKAYRGLAGFRFESSLGTWIYRIAINECQNQNRRHGYEHVPIEAVLGTGEDMDTGALPDELHLTDERREIIREALLSLSPHLRTVIVLRYLEGLSYKEIASVLECSAGTVASRLSRALCQLEERLRPLRRLL